MSIFRCKTCGGTIEGTEGTEAVCQACGVKQTLSTPNNKADSGGARVENAKTAPLLERVQLFLEDGEWDSADKYCERVLDIEPKNAKAYLGKLMVELKVRNQEDLQNCSNTFTDSKNYQKIVRFADDELKERLAGYIDCIDARNEKAGLTPIYKNAKNIMSAAKTEKSYRAAGNLFKSIVGYKDAEFLAEECYKLANVKKLEEQTKKQPRKVVEKNSKLFKKIATVTLIVCALIIIFTVVGIKIATAVEYNNAVALFDEGKYVEAIFAFEELDGYKDSLERIQECKYNDAIARINSGDYICAYNTLRVLGEYKDSVEKAEAIYDEYKIAKIKTAKVGDDISFGRRYIQGDGLDDQEITWRVLRRTDNEILVISNKALINKQYEENGKSANWETCSLRSWLNNNFVEDTFSNNEQNMLLPTKISTGNITTYDKVFLLSKAEKEKYFESEESSICCNGYGDACKWWLRLEGSYYSGKAPYVSKYGSSDFHTEEVDEGGTRLYYFGDGGLDKSGWYNKDGWDRVSISDYTDYFYGVRPAMWIDIS